MIFEEDDAEDEEEEEEKDVVVDEVEDDEEEKSVMDTLDDADTPATDIADVLVRPECRRKSERTRG